MKHVFQAMGAVVLALLIAVPVLVWRLSSGPMTLDFLTPSIESALTARDGRFTVKLDGTVLALGPRRHLLEVRALGVKVFAADGGLPVLTVPQLALTFDGRSLLRGVLAPSSVRIYGLKLKLVRDTDGHFAFGVGEQEAESQPAEACGLVDELVDGLMGPPDSDKPGRSLQRAAILDADLLVEDRQHGLTLHAPEAAFQFRRVPTGLEALADLTLDLAGEKGSLSAKLAYTRQGGGIDGQLRLAGIRPAALAGFGGGLASLAALDMPLTGVVNLHGTTATTLEEATFDLAGGAGRLVLPAPVSTTEKVESAVLRGVVDHGLTRVRIDDLSADLGGPKLSLSGMADGLGGDTAITAEATLRAVPFDSLASLWPAAVAPNPRAWIVANLSKGMVHEARVNLAARLPAGKSPDDLEISKVDGRLTADGVTVEYLRPLPPVLNGNCIATFDAKDFRIAVNGGQIYGLTVAEGNIVLGGLDADLQTADIDLTVNGPVPDALKLVDHPPLRYAAALGIQPDKLGGIASTRLQMRFPLLNDLRLDQLAIKVHSHVKEALVPKVLLGLDLSHGDLSLDIDGSGMDLAGNALLGTIPAHLQWRENFSSTKVPFRSRYLVQAAKVDEAQRRSLGLDTPPFVAPWMDGPVAATVNATVQPGGKAEVEVKADLTAAKMALPGLAWRKLDGTTGGAQALIRVDQGKLAAIPKFSVVAGDLQARGAVSFTPEGKIRQLDLQRIAFGRTDADGSIAFRAGGGMDVTMKGASFDASEMVSSPPDPDAPDPNVQPAPKQPKKKSDLPPMSIVAAFRSLWLSEHGKLGDATVQMGRDAADWQTMTLKGSVESGKLFTASLKPAGPKRRAIKAASDDAGGVLRAFDVYSDLMGGKLDVDGVYEDDKDDQPVSGTVHIKDYNIVHAPALARLLTVAALTGILDVLQGEGITFSTLDAPFTLADGLFKVDGARAYGPALGITAKGEFDLDHSRMAVEGTVVPAYALNSALGNIPVLGWLVTGGDKGGGLVAFNYSMRGPTDDPEVVVNPLSALTPGFLRKLFDIFDSGTDTRKPAGAPQAPAQTPAPAAN